MAIDPDAPGGAPDKIRARTFAAREPGEAASWIVAQNATHNVYWTVNPVLKPLAKKPSREDIATLAFLHVDVDPDKQKPLADERARIADLFSDHWPQGAPRATLIVDSGGGYQAFWQLDEPMPIGGTQAAYDDAALYNQQLEAIFQADPCHNVDRIMRLPGTVNWPDARKRAAGRTPALAKLVEDTGQVHPLSAFRPAPPRQLEGPLFEAPRRQVQTSNVERLQSLDELGDGVPGRVKVVINVGHDPDNPKRWASRSEPLFWVCCELVRSGVSDDVIYSVITDPDFAISESVLEKGARAEKYALRQIANAHEEAVDPDLARVNRQHAVVADLGGKCRIMSEGYDELLGRPLISYQTFEDFANRYANQTIAVDDKAVPLGRWWIGHPGRRSYERVVFSPEQEIAGAYNLWRGFACEAIPGDCSLYLDHLRRNICGGEAVIYEYLLSWMACAVQHPAEAGQTAIVMRGLPGVGKGVFAQGFGSLFGRHFMQVTNPIQLVGQFNTHLKECVVMFADEAFYAGDKRHEAVLKALITEEKIVTEAKYHAAEMSRNCLHVIMASNSDWVVPAGGQSRRFLVLDAGPANLQDTAFFGRVSAQMESGGREALLHTLLSRDLTGYDPRAVPKTAALQEQKQHSFSVEEEWLHEALRAGTFRDGEQWPEWLVCSEVYHSFGLHAQSWGRGGRGSVTRLNRLLERLGVRRKQLSTRAAVVSHDGSVRQVDRPRVFHFPPLDDVREAWSLLMGGTFAWGDEILTPTTREEPFE